MSDASWTRRFITSRAGRGFIVHLAICALVSGAVGLGFFAIGLNWFKAHKSEEKFIALRLIDAFVTEYSAVRSQFGVGAAIPATFRAHAIEMFNQRRGAGNEFRLRWVGRAGRAIATPPSDPDMAKAIEAFASQPNAKPHAEFTTLNGELMLRTIYPSFAKEQGCVDCHNALQPEERWKLGDLMGAFAIDVPAGAFLDTLRMQSAGLSLALFLALGAIGFVVSFRHFHQLSERDAVHAELAQMRTFLHTVIEHMPASLTVKDARTSAYALINRSASRLFDIARDAMIGHRPQDLFDSAQADKLMVRDRAALDARGRPIMTEHTVTGPGGETRVLNTTKVAVMDENQEPQYIIAFSEDITDRKRAEAQIAHMAHHDGLTDLPNRVAFSEAFGSVLREADQSDQSFAVLCLDLDRFKDVNDVYGHTAGDRLLCEVAQRFRVAAQDAFLARFGGDEFTLVTACGPQPDVAMALAERLHEAIDSDIEIDGHRIRVGLSIGVAVYPDDGADETALLGNADAALYRAKAEGRGHTQFFEAAMDHHLRERRALQQDLQLALAHGELTLHFQPQARIGGQVVGMEALCRWHHPRRGMISPGVFIPLAEETGLIMAIGEWVMHEACREAASWPKPLRLAVNLSPVQFRHSDIVGLVHEVLLATGLSPNRLELEITEGVLVEDFAGSVSILRRLKALGVRIAMDDFGTGYSSLSYLQAFPFDRIKIDRSFIKNADSNMQSAAIVRGVLALARGLGLPVLAEGVETEGQRSFLEREGCDEMQGYLIGRPLPVALYAPIVGRAAAPELLMA